MSVEQPVRRRAADRIVNPIEVTVDT